jgi:hypothetical protein
LSCNEKKLNPHQVLEGFAKESKKSNSNELLKIIRDLYDLNEENRRFLCTRLVSATSKLQDYKEIIRRGVYPDALSNERFDLKSARKAISDFKKACDDPNNVLELMVHYVEQGNQCTVDYGDIDEHFYSSLESMFDAVLQILKKSSDKMVAKFLPRLRNVVAQADGIGWGYYDYLSDTLEAAFPEDATVEVQLSNAK